MPIISPGLLSKPPRIMDSPKLLGCQDEHDRHDDIAQFLLDSFSCFSGDYDPVGFTNAFK